MSRIAAWLCLAIVSPAVAAELAPFKGDAAGAVQPPWVFSGLPGVSKPPTSYKVVTLDGQSVLRIDADNSYGNLTQTLPKLKDGRFLSWRWRVDVPNLKANVHERSGDDRAVQVCVTFDLPLDAVPFGERQLFKLAEVSAGQDLPTAMVCYLWDSKLMTGSVLDDAFSRRLRMIVLRGASAPLNTWFDERRDVRADFLHLFGDEAKQVPPITGVGVQADSDNTHVHSLAYLTDLELTP